MAGDAIGTVVGGTATGVLLGGAGRVLGDALPSAMAAAAIAAAVLLAAGAIALEFRGGLAPLPQRHAQLPSRWMRWRSPIRLGLARVLAERDL